MQIVCATNESTTVEKVLYLNLSIVYGTFLN